jgi:hypothetical protein
MTIQNLRRERAYVSRVERFLFRRIAVNNEDYEVDF